MAKPIGTLGTVDTLTVGGCVFTDLANLIVLVAQMAQATGPNSGMRVPGGTAARAVTSGKTLTIRSVRVITNVAGLADIAYADNDPGVISATALTNGKFYTANGAVNGSLVGGGTQTQTYVDTFFPVPATKFVICVAGTGGMTGTMLAYGYEA